MTMLSSYRLLSSYRATVGKLMRSYVSASDLLFGEETPILLTAENSRQVKSFQAYPIAKNVNGKFVTPYCKETKRSLWEVLRLVTTSQKKSLKFPTIPDSKQLLKPIITDRAKLRSVASPHTTWLGHATCYFQTENNFILTDPVWGDRASPFSFMGPKRYTNIPIEIEDLKIDLVLLSHTHYDHLDLPSAKRIGNRAKWIVPLGVGKVLKSVGVTNVVELDWWGSYNHLTPNSTNLEIMFLPTKHWTSRTLWDRNACLWGAFAVLGREAKFFFGGDTAYCPVFKLIGENLGPFDMAAIPIGAYSPRWFMKDVHCNPEEAVRIHQDLRAKQSFGIHWGTFPMTEEDPVEPALELARIRDVKNIPSKSFFTLAQGETAFLDHSPVNDFATLYNEYYGHYLQGLRGSKSLA